MAFAAPFIQFLSSTALKMATLVTSAQKWLLLKRKILLPLLNSIGGTGGKERDGKMEVELQGHLEALRRKVRPQLLKIMAGYHETKMATMDQFIQALANHQGKFDLRATLQELHGLVDGTYDPSEVDKVLAETLTTKEVDRYIKAHGGDPSQMVIDLFRKGIEMAHTRFRREISDTLKKGEVIVRDHQDSVRNQMIQAKFEMENLDRVHGDAHASEEKLDLILKRKSGLSLFNERISGAKPWAPVA